MRQIEAKFRVGDVEAIREAIRQLSPLSKTIGFERDTYFIHSKAPGLKDTRTFLRVRSADTGSSTAMHCRISDYEWEEIETNVGDGDIIRAIYTNLGFVVDVEVVKQRETYVLPDAEFLLDTVEGLGTFVEIEANSKISLNKYCDYFGFRLAGEDPFAGLSYADLVRATKAIEEISEETEL